MQDYPPASSQLDGSGQALRQLLAELCALAGQDAASPPQLELQFGAVVTRSTVEEGPQGACLRISARLPGPDQEVYAALAQHSAQAGGAGLECVWHAEQGCHLAVRRIALAGLADERSVMDAILDTADLVQRWHASIMPDRPAAC